MSNSIACFLRYPVYCMALTQSDLDTLDRAIASGAQEVRFQDRTVVYRSTQDMLDARSLLANQLSTPATIRQVRMYGEKGW